MTMQVAIPETSAELEEALHDPARMQRLLASPGDLKTFIAGYADAHARQDRDELSGQAGEQMTKVLKEFYEKHDTSQPVGPMSRLPMDPATAGVSRGESIYAKLDMKPWQRRQCAATGEGPNVAVSGEYEDFREYARAISPHVTNVPVDLNRLKVLGEGQGDQGGFLVPEEFRVELLMESLDMSVVRPRARVLPMSGLTVRIPTIRDTTHASNVFGGVQAYWTPESGTITSSEPSFGQAVLTAKKLAGLTRVGNELIRDSAITLEPLLNTMFADAIAFFEDDAFIAGIGGGQPVGVLQADALISVAKETGQAANTVLVENIIKMYSRMLPRSISRAIWYMNPDVQTQLYTMSLSVGTGGAPMFFPAGGITGAPTPTLLGRPIVLTEKAETLGTAGDIVFADLGYYLIGDRQAIEMATSMHTRFATDESDIRFIERVDGRPWMDSALTPRKGTNTLSPFLTIATRA